MRAPIFAPTAVMIPERIVHRLLDASPRFESMAESIGEGWPEIVAAAHRVQKAQQVRLNRPEIADVNTLVFTEEFDVDAIVTSNAEYQAFEERSHRHRQVIERAALAVLDAGNGWVRRHEVQLCEMISARRLEIQAELRTVLELLEGMSSAKELAYRPQHVEAYGRMQALLVEWNQLRDVHAGVIVIESRDMKWFGASWVANYTELWPQVRANTKPPWQTTDEFELARLIADTITSWTPTSTQLDSHLAKIGAAAERALESSRKEEQRLSVVPR